MDHVVPRMAMFVLLTLFVAVAPTRAQDADPAVADGAPTDSVADATVPPALDDPWSSPEITPRMDARPLARHRESTPAQTSTTAAPANRASWLRTTASLGAVIGLIVLLGWGYRVATANSGRLRGALGGRRAGLIEIVSRAALAPRQSLCLVRIGPRLVLIGLTHESVRTLDVIDDPELTAKLLGQAAQDRPDSHSAEFNRCLEREARAYSPDGDDLDETVAPDESRVAQIKEKLAGTIRRLQATATNA